MSEDFCDLVVYSSSITIDLLEESSVLPKVVSCSQLVTSEGPITLLNVVSRELALALATFFSTSIILNSNLPPPIFLMAKVYFVTTSGGSLRSNEVGLTDISSGHILFTCRQLFSSLPSSTASM